MRIAVPDPSGPFWASNESRSLKPATRFLFGPALSAWILLVNVFGRLMFVLVASSVPLRAGCILVLVIGFSLAAYGANPAEEMAKVGTTDPKGDSWQAIQHSIEQFAHPEFLLRLLLSLSLAVACAWAIAWHPRRSGLIDALSDLEEEKALILLGMVGATVAELSGSNQT